MPKNKTIRINESDIISKIHDCLNILNGITPPDSNTPGDRNNQIMSTVYNIQAGLGLPEDEVRDIDSILNKWKNEVIPAHEAIYQLKEALTDYLEVLKDNLAEGRVQSDMTATGQLILNAYLNEARVGCPKDIAIQRVSLYLCEKVDIVRSTVDAYLDKMGGEIITLGTEKADTPVAIHEAKMILAAYDGAINQGFSEGEEAYIVVSEALDISPAEVRSTVEAGKVKTGKTISGDTWAKINEAFGKRKVNESANTITVEQLTDALSAYKATSAESVEVFNKLGTPSNKAGYSADYVKDVLSNIYTDEGVNQILGFIKPGQTTDINETKEIPQEDINKINAYIESEIAGGIFDKFDNEGTYEPGEYSEALLGMALSKFGYTFDDYRLKPFDLNGQIMESIALHEIHDVITAGQLIDAMRACKASAAELRSAMIELGTMVKAGYAYMKNILSKIYNNEESISQILKAIKPEQTNESMSASDDEIIAHYQKLVKAGEAGKEVAGPLVKYNSPEINLNPLSDTIAKFSESGTDTDHIRELIAKLNESINYDDSDNIQRFKEILGGAGMNNDYSASVLANMFNMYKADIHLSVQEKLADTISKWSNKTINSKQVFDSFKSAFDNYPMNERASVYINSYNDFIERIKAIDPDYFERTQTPALTIFKTKDGSKIIGQWYNDRERGQIFTEAKTATPELTAKADKVGKPVTYNASKTNFCYISPIDNDTKFELRDSSGAVLKSGSHKECLDAKTEFIKESHGTGNKSGSVREETIYGIPEDTLMAIIADITNMNYEQGTLDDRKITDDVLAKYGVDYDTYTYALSKYAYENKTYESTQSVGAALKGGFNFSSLSAGTKVKHIATGKTITLQSVGADGASAKDENGKPVEIKSIKDIEPIEETAYNEPKMFMGADTIGESLVIRRLSQSLSEMIGDPDYFYDETASANSVNGYSFMPPYGYNDMPIIEDGEESKNDLGHETIIAKDVTLADTEGLGIAPEIRASKWIPKPHKIDGKKLTVTDGDTYYHFIWRGDNKSGNAELVSTNPDYIFENKSIKRGQIVTYRNPVNEKAEKYRFVVLEDCNSANVPVCSLKEIYRLSKSGDVPYFENMSTNKLRVIHSDLKSGIFEWNILNKSMPIKIKESEEPIAGMTFFDTRRGLRAQILSVDGDKISWRYFGKDGKTIDDSQNVETLGSKQFDYLVSSGAYQSLKDTRKEDGVYVAETKKRRGSTLNENVAIDKEYKFFVVNKDTKKIVWGSEFKEDAEDYKKEITDSQRSVEGTLSNYATYSAGYIKSSLQIDPFDSSNWANK